MVSGCYSGKYLVSNKFIIDDAIIGTWVFDTLNIAEKNIDYFKDEYKLIPNTDYPTHTNCERNEKFIMPTEFEKEMKKL